MARKLDSDETLAFGKDLNKAEDLSAEDLFLQTLGEKRDAILSMSPELRAFFDKASNRLFSDR